MVTTPQTIRRNGIPIGAVSGNICDQVALCAARQPLAPAGFGRDMHAGHHVGEGATVGLARQHLDDLGGGRALLRATHDGVVKLSAHRRRCDEPGRAAP